MKKIPTLFVRDPDNRTHVINEVTPGCEWVFEGEGIATRKYDGTCILYDDGDHRWWARREVKPGKEFPTGYLMVDHDPFTGKYTGWEPVELSPFYKFFQEAVAEQDYWVTGTYELCGPKINGNPEGFPSHKLIQHAAAHRLDLGELSYESISNQLRVWPYEGVVWHHPDGRMAKIKKRDFV